MTARQAARRFVVLRMTRWFPAGLIIPVLVLLLLERGLSLGQIGLVVAAQGAVVMLLELPTGGLADSIGRRPVLIAAAVFEAASIALLIIAEEAWLIAVVFALQGVYRALESGPLEAWYVDTAQAEDPAADIEGGLARGGVALGVAIGAGALASSALVAFSPFPGLSALTGPLAVAVAMRMVDLIAITGLMVEPPRHGDLSFGRAVRTIPRLVGESLRLVRASRVICALLAIEFLWGAGMVAFEALTPARLGQVLDDSQAAAALLGPTNAVAWLVSAAGAALVPRLTVRTGAHNAGSLLLGFQAAMVAALGLAGGAVGIITAYVAIMAVHGAANPVHQGLLHRAVIDPGQRATVASANSLTASVGGAIGGIGLGALADAVSLRTAVFAGALLLAAAAPLYQITAGPNRPPTRRSATREVPRRSRRRTAR